MRRFSLSVYWFAFICSIVGCSQQSETFPSLLPSHQPETMAATTYQPQFIDDKRLHNAYRLHDKVISGGVPDEASMQALKELGVKSIISVDGATPDVELAKRYGMRYVHLPHGYDGVPENRIKGLAKAVRDLDGPIFIHCHHGKHRSPAAAAAACIAAGLVRPEDGVSILKFAGTSENYRGLFQSVEGARPLSNAQLDEFEIEFQEVVDIPPLAEAMVALEKTYDRLKTIADNNWRVTAKHTGIDSAHEALLMQEHYTEMLRLEEVRQQPEEFQSILRDSEKDSRELHEVLLQVAKAGEGVEIPAQAAGSFNRVTKNCKSCHQRFRDIPLHGK